MRQCKLTGKTAPTSAVSVMEAEINIVHQSEAGRNPDRKFQFTGFVEALKSSSGRGRAASGGAHGGRGSFEVASTSVAAAFAAAPSCFFVSSSFLARLIYTDEKSALFF